MSGTWASGWITGDVGSATEFAKSWGSIFDTTLGASAANVDITGIVGSYAHLMVWIYARGDSPSLGGSMQVRFNGDTAANYDFQSLLGKAAASSALEGLAQTSAGVADTIPYTNAGANLFGAALMFIPHYAGSTNNKACISVSSSKLGTSTTNLQANIVGGHWRSTAAINRITLFPASGNFVAGTRVGVYALGA